MLTKKKAHFSLEAFDPAAAHSESIKALCAEKAQELGFAFDGHSIDVDLDSPEFVPLVDWLTELHRQKFLRPAMGGLYLDLVDSPATPYAWFEFKPKHRLSHIIDHSWKKFHHPAGKAHAAKPGVQVGHSMLGTFIAESVKAMIVRHGFTGLEYLWVEDVGLYQALQWYWLIPQASMGRSVDHPFFDPTKHEPDSFEPWPERRYGVSHFGHRKLKSTNPFQSPAQDRFVSLFPSEGWKSLNFMTYRQYLASHLPGTDFAYGRKGRPAVLCFTRRVRDALLAHQFVTEDECVPILTSDEVPEGVEAPDRSGLPQHTFSPWYSPEEIRRLQEEKAAAYQHFLRHPKPVRRATLENALRLLREAQAADPDWFEAGASESALADAAKALGFPIPSAWCEVLKVANFFNHGGDPLSDDVQISRAEELAGNQDYLPYGLEKARYVRVTDGGCGDCHCLDLSTLNAAGDCHVIEFSHETSEPFRFWSSIPEFIEEFLIIRAMDEREEDEAEE